MKPVKIGVIGIGNMGSYHANHVNGVKGAELVAVCDTNPKAFERVDEALRSKVKCFTSSKEFFAKSGAELVMIAVPHYDHPDLAIAAMQHGMHFILEKPICVHKAEAERLLAACKKYPKLVKSAMFNQRTRHVYQKIKDLIDNGDLGKLQRVNWIITDWFRAQGYYDSGDWRASWAGEGGGVLTNQCPHQLDLMTWFFGMPKLVDAHIFIAKYHDIEVEDEVNAYLEYENGVTGNFITTTGEAPGTNRLEICGNNGKLVCEKGQLVFFRNRQGTKEAIVDRTRGFKPPETWEIPIPVDPDVAPTAHMGIVANVIDAIRNGGKLMAPVEEGIRGLELGNAMMLSGWLKRPVELPIDSKVYAEHLKKLVAKSRYKKGAVKKAAAKSKQPNMGSTFGS